MRHGTGMGHHNGMLSGPMADAYLMARQHDLVVADASIMPHDGITHSSSLYATHFRHTTHFLMCTAACQHGVTLNLPPCRTLTAHHLCPNVCCGMVPLGHPHSMPHIRSTLCLPWHSAMVSHAQPYSMPHIRGTPPIF